MGQHREGKEPAVARAVDRPQEEGGDHAAEEVPVGGEGARQRIISRGDHRAGSGHGCGVRAGRFGRGVDIGPGVMVDNLYSMSFING